MTVIEIDSLDDPRLADYSHQTDVALKKAQGTERGLYIAGSALVLGRALRAGHRPRSVLALGASVSEALELTARHDVPISVSYTHLDVYKRQLAGVAPVSSAAALETMASAGVILS